MKEFLHNGERVIYQETQDESFLDFLNKSGIIPEEVPDENLRYRVFKYTKDGQKRYACVLVANAPDAYIEKVYITFSYPEDGFYNMMLDITGQIDGEKPEIINSRIKIALKQAEIKAKDWIDKKYPDECINWLLYGYPDEVQKEYDYMKKLALNSFGYYIETLTKISAPDVDMEYMINILK